MTAALWPQLVSTALVGTQRRAAATITVPEAMASLASGGIASDADLLETAGALALARRAGVGVTTDVTSPVPSAADDLPLAPTAAQRRLRLLLGTSVDADLVELWLTLAVERGLGVPGRDLANLFRLGRANERLRDLIAQVAGVRGAWLAAQHKDWVWVGTRRAATIDVDDPAMWTEGAIADRVAYLTTARRRDPAEALSSLTRVWSAEPPAERIAMMAALRVGLGPGDEEFLEAALDDRRKEVRTAAAELLGALPGSAYERRMAARAAALVSRTGKKLVVTLPEECDAAMKRDGVEPKPRSGTGERAWWFEQIVAAAPMSTWDGLDATPGELATLKVADDFGPTLRRAWATAAVRTRDAIWAEAMLAAGFGTGSKASYVDIELATSLHRVLPADQAVDTALARLAMSGTQVAHATAIVDICPRPWPRPLTTALFGFIETELRGARNSYVPYQLRELGQAVVNAAPPGDVAADTAALAASLADLSPHITTLMESLVTLADTRYQILQEFA
jgi:hypothetical protein